MKYPSASIEKNCETLAGVSFPDPYRWLERKNVMVSEWQREQAELADAHVSKWAHFSQLRGLIARFSTERFISLPRYAAGRWFFVQVAEDNTRVQAIVSDQPMGQGRVLFDARKENAHTPPFLSWVVPSPDGRILALGVCADGSENNTIRLIDVETAEALPAPSHILMDARTGGVHWLPNSTGFFFSAITGAAIEFNQGVYLHCCVPKPTTILVEIGWTEERDYRAVVVSSDGRYAVALERLRKPIPIAIAALGGEALVWRPFITKIDGTVAGHAIEDTLIAVTDVGAPRGRLVAIPLDARDPNDPSAWQELVPESEAVQRSVTPVGEVLYLTEFVDSYTRVRIVDRAGRSLGEMPLPFLGSINELPFPLMTLVTRAHTNRFVYAFSSLTVSHGIYSHAPGDSQLETLREPKAQLYDAVVEDLVAVSKDGTHIPYHLVRRADIDSMSPQPTLIYAYGGLNVALTPQFPGAMAAFVAAGGLFVHAHLRGGGEFGLEWWHGGRMQTKQNCYDDLYAVAEDLIARGRCTPQALAVTGSSNGGLMAGVAATQRPDLWGVVVPRVPWLDLIGTCREPWGRMYVKAELADIEDPEEVRRLASISPYHLVRDGVKYPAIYLDAGETDPRCPPWHACKFAARLQRATAGTAPILLRVWPRAGHGPATDKITALNQDTAWLAFTIRHLGLRGWE